MSYSDQRERASPARSSTVSQTSTSSYYETPIREQGGWKNGNESWRRRNNWRSQAYLGPRYEHVGTGDYRGNSSFIAQSHVPCYNCGDGAHPRRKCLFYGRMCPRCFKVGHSPDYCRSRGPVAGVSFYHNACYFSAEIIVKLASLDFDTRREEIKCMYSVLTPDEVSVISLAMEMYESDDLRRARCFRCRAFHSPGLCWYSDRQCVLCGHQGHAEVACRVMSLSRNNCKYHYFDPYSSNQGGAFPYAPQLNLYDGEVANVMEPQYLPTQVADTVDITEVAESNWVDTCWADPDPVGTCWADSDFVDPSSAGPDPVDESNCKIPDTVDSSSDVPDLVDPSCEVPYLVDPTCNVPYLVDSGCAASNVENESGAVAAPANPSFGTEGSIGSYRTAGDPTYFNGETISNNIPNAVVEKLSYQNENSVGPVISNLIKLNISSNEPATSADFSTSEPVPSESVNGQDDTKLNQSTADLNSSCSGELVICTIDSTTTSSSILVSSSFPDESHLSPGPAVACDRDTRFRVKGSTASASSMSSSDDVYHTAEENIHSSEHSDTEIIPSKALISTTEAASERNDSDGQKRIDALPQTPRDRNSVPKAKLEAYASEDTKNGLPEQKSSTEHQSGFVPSIHVTGAVDETGACSPYKRVVSESPVFSSEKNRKRKFPPATVMPPCSRCLSTKHLPENCVAQESTCYRCGCKGHLSWACSEPKPPSSRTPTKSSPYKRSRGRVIDRVRSKEAAYRPSTDSDSALPPSPVLSAPTRDLPSPAVTSSMSSPENIHCDKSPSDKSTASKFPPTSVLPPCSRCLSTKHLPENCVAQESTCHRCGCKGHFSRACSEPKLPSSKTPTENSPYKRSRGQVIDRVRKNEAACRSSTDSDSALPPSPVLYAPTRDPPSPAATSSMSSPDKIPSDTSPLDGGPESNSQNWWSRSEDVSQLANITPACPGSNCFKTQETDQDEEKVATMGPTSQQRMMGGDATSDPRHKQPQLKQRRDDQRRNDRLPQQHYSSRGSPSKQNRKPIDLVAAASAAAASAGSSVRQEPRGTPLALLNRMSAAHPGVPGVTPSRQHDVLVQLPVPHGHPPLPYPAPSAAEDIWDQFHVRMPCSPSSLYARDSLPLGYPDTRSRDTVPRWNVIKWALNQPLKSVDDVQRAIVSYNSRYHDKWLLHGLKAVVLQFSEEEEDQFFCRTLPGMCRLALRLPELVTRAPSLLVAHRCKAVTLSQMQIASLLANAFFCTFPRRNAKGSDTEYAHFPDINFSRLLNADGPTVLEKIKCLLNYFRVVSTTEPVGLVTFARHMVENAPAVVWQQCTSALPRLHCDDGGLIEEATGLLQVDFANRFLGGGVLGHGCVQEEIRFMLCPELLITRLLAEALDKNEAIIVVGVEQYSRGEGYADSFLFAGRHEDTTPRDGYGRRMCQLTAIDAVHFRARPSVQFKEELVVREINKAYAGFCPLEGTAGNLAAVATGNWGCGAFRGNPHLKALLQLAACGYAGRDVAYFTFLDAKLKNRIADMHEFLVKGGVTVGALVQCICQYGALSREVDGSDLYQYLYHNLRDPSRTPSPGDSPRPADQGPQQTGNTSERTSGSSWAAKSREMNGNGFDGANGKNGAHNKARMKETVANNTRMTDFFPRLNEKGPWENKNGTDSLTGTGKGSIASVHQPSSCSPCALSQSSGGFWDDSSPGQGAFAKGSGGRGGGRHKRNRGRAKEGLTDQQIVDAITEPDTIQENGDVRGEEIGTVRGEENGSGPGEEFTSTAAKRGRKKKNKGNRKNAHTVKDGNVLNSPVRVNKFPVGLDKKLSTGPDDHRLTGKKSVGYSSSVKNKNC